MPTYAVLGATGVTGQALLNILLESPKNTVNAYVRSKAKLLKLFPQHQGNDNLRIFEGPLTDVEVIADCITNTSAVLSVLGAPDNEPGIHVGQDAAHSIVAGAFSQRPNSRGRFMQDMLTSSSSQPAAISAPKIRHKSFQRSSF